MKRKILRGIAILTLAGATFNVIFSDGTKMFSSQSLINSVVAFSSGENESGTWIRHDETCTTVYSGAPYTPITLPNGTIIYLDGNGKASFTSGEKTDCEINGTHLILKI
jgi:hypothetical protein